MQKHKMREDDTPDMQSAELARPWIRGTCDYATPDDASTCVPGQRRGVWRRVRSAARCFA